MPPRFAIIRKHPGHGFAWNYVISLRAPLNILNVCFQHITP
jgi:hypothetical protein